MRCSNKAKIWFAYVRPECWQCVVSIRNRCDVLPEGFGTGANRSVQIALVKPWCSCNSAKRVWKDLKDLSHCWHILKSLAWSFQSRRLQSVPGQSLPLLTILVPLRFIVTSLMFFYLGKLLFSGFLSFEEFVLGQKTDEQQWLNFFDICFAKCFASKPNESRRSIASFVQVGEYKLTELALHFCRLFERLHWTFTKDLTFTLNFPLLSSKIFFGRVFSRHARWTKRKRDFGYAKCEWTYWNKHFAVTIFELLLIAQIHSSLAPFPVVLLLFFSVLNQRQVSSLDGFL